MVVEHGVYVLTSSIAGIVEKSKVIDGSKISEGDVVLAIASNGLHTNGYSLVRLLMEKMPQIKLDRISDEEMLRTFNCGVGFNLVVPAKYKELVVNHICQYYDCYEIGKIIKDSSKIAFEKRVDWV